MEEQKDDLLEADFASEFIDIIAAVEEDPFRAFHLAQPRFRRHHAFETFADHCHVGFW